MRLFAMAALTAIGLGLAATSGAFAIPISVTSIGKAASAISPLVTMKRDKNPRQKSGGFVWTGAPAE